MSGKKQGLLVVWLLFTANTAITAPPVTSESPTASPPVTATPADNTTPAPATPSTVPATFTPEALEELLAPVALYPDGVLAQVLAASTRPQEVMDAGNWLVAHPDVKGKELEAATQNLGFTQAMVALMQFPDVVDMMCLKMSWTTELGTAFLADEPAVLAAVQRLRKQAADIGNLKSSDALKVDAVTVNDQDVITVTSPDPKVVYVPQYDPVNTYTTPAPAAAPEAAVATATTGTATATATNTTVTEEGHSTTSLVTTGLLAFGAGILVNEVFDDDDEYHPYWGGGGGYYPPPYYPNYGNGFYPSHNYNNFNKNNVLINNGNRNDYWNRFDGNRNDRRRDARSPISEARPKQGDLGRREQADWKGRSDYAGSQPAAREKMMRDRPGTTPTRAQMPTGKYAGARPSTRQSAANIRQPLAGKRTGAAARPTTRKIASNRPASNDRGRATARRNPPAATSRRGNAFEGINRGGKFERAASNRGRASAQRQRGGGQRSAGGRQAGGRRR